MLFPLCANDDETRTFREFKLEGYGSDIQCVSLLAEA
jgi:hypothetical protein